MTGTFPEVIDGYGQDPLKWLEANRQRVDAILESTGALLLREFAVDTPEHFSSFVCAFSRDVLDYVYRSTPRTRVGAGVFTATEYPAGLDMAMHNENAYQRTWPLHVLFFCAQPAESGGQTPIGSTVNITKRIDPTIRRKCLDHGIMYVRNYRDGVDLPWREVFQTDSRAEVERYCAEHEMTCEWRADGGLRTTQICQGLARHPGTGKMVWFNSAHMFHPSSLDVRTQSLLCQSGSEDDWPRNVKYGDGTAFSETELASIRGAFKAEEKRFKWQRKDVLILDNMLVCHGREPYRGSRKVLAALCDSSAHSASR